MTNYLPLIGQLDQHIENVTGIKCFDLKTRNVKPVAIFDNGVEIDNYFELEHFLGK